MDSKTGSKQIPRNLEVPSPSLSALDLDPDPVTDSIEILHGSPEAKSGNFLEQIFSSVANAARRAVESVLSVFFTSDTDVDPIIHISKPRKLRRNENDLPREWQKDNEVVRNKYYDSLFKSEPVKDSPSDTRTQPASQLPDPASSPSTQVADVEKAKPVEVSVGEKTFHQYFTLFQEKEGDMPFSPGYFAFTPECLDYAKKIAKLAIGKDVSAVENSEIIRAALGLVKGESEIRLAQDQLAAQEVRKQEKLAKIEEQKTKQPGQSAFEEFFAMYQNHVRENSPVIIVEGSKFLSDECLAYADTIETDPQFIEGAKKATVATAAAYLFMWKANPTKALEKARAATDFQMPPPPKSLLSRLTGVDVPVPPMTWETAVSGLSVLSDSDRDKLVAIFQMNSLRLEQAFKGLQLAPEAALKKVKPGEVAGAGRFARFSSMPPDSRPTVIDDLQRAQYLLIKIKDSNIGKQLKDFPILNVILNSSELINQVIEEQLRVLLPEPKKAVVKVASKPAKLEPLSGEAEKRAEEDFDNYVISFTRAINKGNVNELFSDSNYLTRSYVAIAQSIVDKPGNKNENQPDDAENLIRVDRLSAALFLLSKASQLANMGNAKKGGQQ